MITFTHFHKASTTQICLIVSTSVVTLKKNNINTSLRFLKYISHWSSQYMFCFKLFFMCCYTTSFKGIPQLPLVGRINAINHESNQRWKRFQQQPGPGIFDYREAKYVSWSVFPFNQLQPWVPLCHQQRRRSFHNSSAGLRKGKMPKGTSSVQLALRDDTKVALEPSTGTFWDEQKSTRADHRDALTKQEGHKGWAATQSWVFLWSSACSNVPAL